MNKLVAFALLLAACCLGTMAEGKTVLAVDVYYESLCPDSVYFITQELAPAYKDLKDVLRINLVPFGKASWMRGAEGQPAAFRCQHGPSECEGNRAQACALYEIERTLADSQQKQIDVVSCTMSNRNSASAVPECARKNGISEESVQRIISCSSNDFGNELLIKQGEKTKAFESPLTFVPTIVINGEKKSEAFRNFSATVCGSIPIGEKPAACGPPQ